MKRFQVQLDGKKDEHPRGCVSECVGRRVDKHILRVLCESRSWNTAEAVWPHRACPLR